MRDFILKLKPQFSDEEKQKCLPIAYRMVELTYIARENGILGLEEEIILNNKDSDFMKMGANLIVNGITPDIIERTFQHYLLSGRYTGADLLEKLLIAEGLLIITWGVDTSLRVAYTVGAMLGEKYMDEIVALTDIKIDIEAAINEYTSPLAESADFEKKFLSLTNIELYKVLNDSLINTVLADGIIATALKGCSKSFIYHMRKGLSEYSFLQVCKYFRYHANKEDILENQAILLRDLARLRGEI